MAQKESQIDLETVTLSDRYVVVHTVKQSEVGGGIGFFLRGPDEEINRVFPAIFNS